MNRNEYNAEQLQAIDVDVNKNVLVSAAAGSGKTKTLSTRVFELINNGKIKPSELLVLTFTKNAAHEMKTRIIKTFKSNKKDDLANEMKSAHIQTFDSFSLELVEKNAGRFGIADTVSIIDNDIIKLKKTSIIREILNDYYTNDKERIINSFKKFNSKNDDATVKVILDLDEKLEKMTNSQKNDFIDNYYENFLTEEMFKKFFDQYIKYYKDIVIENIYKAYFFDKCDKLFKTKQDKKKKNVFGKDYINDITEYLSNIDNFKIDYRHLDFEKQEVQDLYDSIILALNKDSNEFIDFVQNAKDYPEFQVSLKAGKDKDAYETLKRIFVKSGNANPLLKDLVYLSGIDEAYSEYVGLKDDIFFLFEIIKELDKRIFNYKKISCNFTYNDIAKFTDDLLSEEKYADIQASLRRQFKYIMVDEYQDSNDYQESLINSLLKHTEEVDSHLFCVGDVKQSIYAFRNSKVELFRNRQALYENDLDSSSTVIHMNKNYRSGKNLLNDINYLFINYMRIDNGKINYLDLNEQLHYDDDKNVYNLKYDDFKVKRYLPKFDTNKYIEARMIASDIKRKVESGYLVYDKANKIRPCKYSDFAIIVRTKKGFNMYQKLFYENGIPLNLKVDDVLTEVDAIIVLQTIFALVDYRINKTENADIKHLFASLARSYIYEYSDELLHNILTSKSLDSIYNDKIMKDINEFVSMNKDNFFDAIFLNAINYFGIIKKLNKIGNLSDNVNKIESLYDLVLNQKNNGEGLRDFVELFKTLSKNRIDLSGITNYENDNAVDMMTIHASKGLERKVVYLPTYYNKQPKGPSDKPDYIFSKELGIILPNYLNEINYQTILYEFYDKLLEENTEDDDEFVRLMYVAFTRAENTCIIVGKENKGLYDVYANLPYYYEIDKEFLEKYRVTISSDLIDEYNDSVNNIIDGYDLKKLDLSQLDEYQIDYYHKVFDTLLYSLHSYHFDVIDRINEIMISHYVKILRELKVEDMHNKLALMYGFKLGFYDINSFDELYEKICYLNELNEGEEDDDSDEEDLTDITESELKVTLENFISSIVDKGSINDARYLVYAFDNPKFYFEQNYSYYGFIDSKEYIIPDNLSEKGSKPNINIDSYTLNDDLIEYEDKKAFRASIKIASDEEKEIREKLDYGIYLHHLLELVDFNTLDTSFIKENKDRELIEKALKLPVFSNIKKAKVYREYGYYDNLYDTIGSIDLLYVLDGIYYIIDYKSSDIDKEGYITQLHTYQRNVMEKFNIDSSKIKLYLVSIEKSIYKEVEVE